MVGATIDHIVAVTVLLTAMLLAIMMFNGLFASALEYDSNRQVANRAVDIINTICLSPGSPPQWGENSMSVLGFGLQDPDASGYTLSPYSLMRLDTTSDDNPPVYFDETGLYYNNLSSPDGHAILVPLEDCINYTEVTELLAINGSYGFSFDVFPTVNVNVIPVSNSPVTVDVEVSGSGLPLIGATLNCHLLKSDNNGVNTWVELPLPTVTEATNSSGSKRVVFSGETAPVYSIVVYVSVGGVNGVGYYTNNDLADDVFVVPLIEDYSDGDLILTHGFNFAGPSPNSVLTYNASFFVLTSDFDLQYVDLGCSGDLSYDGGPIDYDATQIPSSEVGLLVISYMDESNTMGNLVVPWGVGALGISSSLNGEFGSEGYSFVATELRQVTIDGVSYQVKVSVWKLGN